MNITDPLWGHVHNLICCIHPLNAESISELTFVCAKISLFSALLHDWKLQVVGFTGQLWQQSEVKETIIMNAISMV